MLQKLFGFIRNFLGRFVAFVRKPKGALITGLAVIVIGFLLSLTQGNPLEQYDIGEVARKDVVSVVDVTGRVEPAERVDMSLERGGKVARINVEVGDEVGKGQTLLSVANADLYADLAEAQANLEIEHLELTKTGSVSEVGLENERNDLADEIEEAYSDIKGVLSSKVDQFYDNPDGNLPVFRDEVTSGSVTYDLNTTFSIRRDLGFFREDIDEALVVWGSEINNIENEDILTVAESVEDRILIVDEILSLLTDAFSEYDNQHLIEDAKADVASARTTVSAALNEVRSAKRDYVQAETESIASEGESLQEVLVQQQRVKNAEARVNSIWAEINKTVVAAPFDGVITRVDTEVGETVSSSDSVVSMMSGSDFEIETFIPEADIADVALDNQADVTLDAYSSDVVFGAYVSFIDPAETIIEGVATYKVLLQFNEEDERVRSGMTANVDIVTGARENALSVPQRAVIEKDGKKFVRVVMGDEVEEVEVTTGLRGFDGDIEILSGLSEGDQIVVFVRG